MGNKSLILEWLKRARSNLERARVGQVSEEILFEDLCFDAQQDKEALKLAEDVFEWATKMITLDEE